MITLNVAASPQPRGPIVLDVLKPSMVKALGYFPFEYWYLFADPIEGPVLIEKHLESMFTVVRAEPDAWKETMCAEKWV